MSMRSLHRLRWMTLGCARGKQGDCGAVLWARDLLDRLIEIEGYRERSFRSYGRVT